MTGTYQQRALGADGWTQRARSEREREAFSEIASLWRRLARLDEPTQDGETRTFAPEA